MAQKVKVGNLMVKDVEYNGVKKKLRSIGLGSKSNKNPKYNQSVEIIVRDSAGKVLARQTDGWLEVVDLSALSFISDLFLEAKKTPEWAAIKLSAIAKRDIKMASL